MTELPLLFFEELAKYLDVTTLVSLISTSKYLYKQMPVSGEKKFKYLISHSERPKHLHSLVVDYFVDHKHDPIQLCLELRDGYVGRIQLYEIQVSGGYNHDGLLRYDGMGRDHDVRVLDSIKNKENITMKLVTPYGRFIFTYKHHISTISINTHFINYCCHLEGSDYAKNIIMRYILEYKEMNRLGYY